MPAAQANILIEQGSGYTQTLLFNDTSGNVIDLTGCSARFVVKGHSTDTTPLLVLDSLTVGGIVMGGTTGTITITAQPTQTAAINLALVDPHLVPTVVGVDVFGNQLVRTGYRALWALELTDSGNNVTRPIEGYVLITPRIVQ